MRKVVRVIAVGIFLLVASFQSPSHAGAQEGPKEPGKVLIIAAPRLTWEDVDVVQPKHLMSLFERGAVALCSVRTAGSITRPGDAYLTIGAGNRMGALGLVDGRVVERTETVPEGDPSALFERTTGVTPTAPILALDKPAIDVGNEELHFASVAGSLASALESDDRSMAVIANADQQFGVATFRQAGLAAMNTDGEVAGGAVAQTLLRQDDSAAFGLELDVKRIAQSFGAIWADHDVVLVELSDLERAEMSRAVATLEQGDREYASALRSGDELVGELMKQVDLSRDTVIVVGPTSPLEETQLTTFAINGPGIAAGWAESSTTRRSGYVTLTDLAPSILASLDVAVPSSMNDTRLSWAESSASFESRIAEMIDRSHRAVARDQAFEPITITFVVVLVINIALAVLCLARLPRLGPLVRWLALLVLAVLPASYLLGLVSIESPVALGVALFAAATALTVLAAITRRFDKDAPPLVLIGLLWLVLAVDIATGGHLQINTVFGYSPIVAGRFAGFGNQAFSMFAIGSMLLAAVFVERRTPRGERIGNGALIAVIGWFALVIVLDGHPAMGSDVGGVLALVPATAIAVMLFRGISINKRLAAAVGAATVLVLVGFAALDLSRPADERTHLGRFASKLVDGDAGEIIQRKIAANLRVLTTVWAWVIPVALVYFVYLTWRPNRTLQTLQGAHSHFRTFGVSALTLGLLSMALNDSGVSLPAIMLAIVAAYVSYLVIGIEWPRSDDPSTDPPDRSPGSPVDVVL